MEKLKFHSAAIQPAKQLERSFEVPTSMSEPYYPGITLSEDALPEAKEWTVGEEYTIVLKVKQTGQRLNYEEKITTDFDIKEVAVYDKDEE